MLCWPTELYRPICSRSQRSPVWPALVARATVVLGRPLGLLCTSKDCDGILIGFQGTIMTRRCRVSPTSPILTTSSSGFAEATRLSWTARPRPRSRLRWTRTAVSVDVTRQPDTRLAYKARRLPRGCLDSSAQPTTGCHSPTGPISHPVATPGRLVCLGSDDSVEMGSLVRGETVKEAASGRNRGDG
ncbi:unnamed protein product [Protopolystoma xenopodis]|uniref:Uncharacterized protein n=1 Tax=Protopolystoma xenopodis TaxID=117903 RepID=A0A3S5CVG8_9PLAT|nr:unnamed protein product [Protopolystoma xenopodis]